MKSKPDKKTLLNLTRQKQMEADAAQQEAGANAEEVQPSITDQEYQHTQETNKNVMQNPEDDDQPYREVMDLDDNGDNQIINIKIDNNLSPCSGTTLQLNTNNAKNKERKGGRH